MNRIEEIRASLDRGQGSHYQKEAIRFLLSELDRKDECLRIIRGNQRMPSLEQIYKIAEEGLK